MAIDKRFKCPDCGEAVIKLWDHGCPTKTQKQEAAKAVVKPLTRAVPKPTINLPLKRSKPLSGSERVKKWRKAHPDEHRRIHREYMKKWRKE